MAAASPHVSATLPLIGDEISGGMNLTFDRDNPPNADILLPSLRQSGYTLETAIGDLADNPLDADANLIVITIDKDGDAWTVSVADNGTGMDSDTLDQMLRLGSRSEHDPSRDLGAFGLGSTTASLYLGRRLHVITRSGPDVVWSGATDLDVIITERRLVKHQAPAQPAELALFEEAFRRWDLAVPRTGTLVRVTKCDNIGRVQFRRAVEAVKKYVGQTYRYFINAGKTFYVNGELVVAVDPLERNNPETLVLFEDTIGYEFPKAHSRAGEKETIGVVLVQLPDGDDQMLKDRGYNQETQGLYLLRNRREIVKATNFDRLFRRHNDLNRFRGELLFPGTMDRDLGVTFQKSTENPSQSLRDKVGEVVLPYIRQAQRFARSSRRPATDQVSHDEAAKIIEARAHLLLKPEAEVEAHADPVPESRKSGTGKRHPSLLPPELRKRTGLADKVRFVAAEGDPHAPIFDATLIGHVVEITYNTGHPFYQRFFLDNQDNRALTNAVDYLVYSMATAELRAEDDTTYEFIKTMREHTSTNLRQLLTT